MAFLLDQAIMLALTAGTSLYNIFSQEDTKRYQKRLQQRMFNREDSARRRGVRDMRLAGLSPTLAAGSGAGAGSNVGISTPEFDNPLGNFLAAKQTMASIAQTEAQMKLIEKQRDSLSQKMKWTELMNPERLHKMEMDNLFTEKSLNTRLELLSANKTQKDLQNELLRLQKEFTNKKISTETLVQAKLKVDTALGNRKIGELNLKMLYLSTAIDLNEINLKQNKYNLDWYEGVGLPTNISPTEIMQYLGVLRNNTKPGTAVGDALSGE